MNFDVLYSPSLFFIFFTFTVNGNCSAQDCRCSCQPECKIHILSLPKFLNLFLRLALTNLRVNHSFFGKWGYRHLFLEKNVLRTDLILLRNGTDHPAGNACCDHSRRFCCSLGAVRLYSQQSCFARFCSSPGIFS